MSSHTESSLALNSDDREAFTPDCAGRRAEAQGQDSCVQGHREAWLAPREAEGPRRHTLGILKAGWGDLWVWGLLLSLASDGAFGGCSRPSLPPAIPVEAVGSWGPPALPSPLPAGGPDVSRWARSSW